MNFDAKTRSWLILICTATASAVSAAAIAHAGGCSTGWIAVAGAGGAATAVLHALMPPPGQAGTQDDPSIQAKYAAERAKIGNP